MIKNFVAEFIYPEFYDINGKCDLVKMDNFLNFH